MNEALSEHSPTAPVPIVPEGDLPAAGVVGVNDLSGRTLLTGSVWVVASQALPQIYILASSVLIARFLSVADMGRQSFIAFAGQSIVMVGSFGFSAALVRYGGELLGQRRVRTLRGLVWWTAKWQFAGALFAGLALFAVGMLSTDLRTAWMWAAVGAVFATMQNVPNAVLSVLRHWREASIITLTIGLAIVVGFAAVLAAGGGVAGVFAVSAFASIAALVWATLLARRYLYTVAPASEPHRDLHRPMIGYAATIWASFLITFVVLRRTEFFFLDRYSTPQAIAYYSVAFAVTAGLAGGIESLAGVVAPTVASLQGAGQLDRVGSGLGRAMRLVLLVSVPLSAFGFVFGPAAIRVIYGSDYSHTTAPLRIMLAAFPIIALMSLCGGLLWGIGRVKTWLFAFAFAAVVDIALDFALIPHHAEIGAACANVFAQLTASAIVVGYTVRAFGPIDWQGRVLLRAFAAAAVAALAGWVVLVALGGAAGLVLGAAVTTVVFVTVSHLLRTVPAIDAVWIADAMHGRFGMAVARVVRFAAAGAPEGETAAL